MIRPSVITALFLAEDETGLALDRKILRRLGIAQSQFFASGHTALEYLHQLTAGSLTATGTDGTALTTAAATVLICNERLADMHGLRFLSMVRSSAGAAHTPALFLVRNGESSLAQVARTSRACAVLARPYTEHQADAALSMAFLPEYRQAPVGLPTDLADKTFVRASAAPKPQPRRVTELPPIPGQAALSAGIEALKRGETKAAENLLHESLNADPERVETVLALSRLYAALGSEEEELSWLCRAGVLCLKRGERTRASNIFSRLPRGKTGQDSLLAQAGEVLQEGESTAAALAFLEAYRLDPSRPLHSLIGRACLFTPTPEEHMRGLIQALARSGHDATACKLQNRLMQPPKEMHEPQSGFLSGFPVLHDIISVAAYTFKTWHVA